MREWRAKNLERAREIERKTKAKNRDKILARKAEYRRKNADKIREYNAAYNAKNEEMRRASRTKWVKNNPDLMMAIRARQRAYMSCPDWVDKGALDQIYRTRLEISERTGVEHHVDHIVPLRGKTVCGLHVPWNLQVIPAAENFRKSNKLVL